MPFKRTDLQLALRARADARRSIDVARKRIASLEARIADLDAKIEAMGGARTLAPRLPFRANGEMQRAVFDLLRRHGSITSADLAAHMLARRGLDASIPQTGYAMRQRAIQALKRLERNKLVRHVSGAGKGGRFKRFMLTADYFAPNSLSPLRLQ